MVALTLAASMGQARASPPPSAISPPRGGLGRGASDEGVVVAEESGEGLLGGGELRSKLFTGVTAEINILVNY
jgi:hypothetical protein